MGKKNRRPPDPVTSQEALAAATLAGELLLKYGAEIARVEDTTRRILTAYGFPDCHVFCMAHGIMVTVNETGPDHCYSLRDCFQEGINLRRIEAVNQISREICRGACTPRAAKAALRACETLDTPWWLLTLASGAAAFSFSYLTGGGLLASLLAFPVGCLLQLFLFLIGRRPLPRLLKVTAGSFAATALSLLAARLIPSVGFQYLAVGAIMPLVPGVAFTVGIRDLFNSHFLSGTIHLLDAVITGVCIALGVGMVILAAYGPGGVQL